MMPKSMMAVISAILTTMAYYLPWIRLITLVGLAIILLADYISRIFDRRLSLPKHALRDLIYGTIVIGLTWFAVSEFESILVSIRLSRVAV